MPESSRSLALLPLPFVLLLALLGLIASGLPALTPTPPAMAEDDEDASGEEEEDDEAEPGADLGDKNLSFADQVNEAIELGTNWVHGKPKLFTIPGTYEEGVKGAHWGLVKGQKIYGGGTGKQYRHPAGPTALALYTLLKCGVKPKDPVIQKGFAWLREVHKLTDDPKTNEWDAMAPPNDRKARHWNHTIAGSSYEISVMILALTAKYDKYKKSSASAKAQKQGRLKIKDRFDRAWLPQLVSALLARRGQPTPTATDLDSTTIKKIADPLKYPDFPIPSAQDLPEKKLRLGWRYNMPFVDLVYWRKKGKSKSKDSFGRRSRVPPHANQDMSSTQLATLALYSAQRFGVKIDPQVWFDIVDFTLDHQEPKGPEHERHDPVYQDGRYAAVKDEARGFMYIKGSTDNTEGIATGSMTACGVGNLLLAKAAIHRNSKDKAYKGARKRWLEENYTSKVEKSIWDGLAWMDKNWSSFQNPRSRYGYHIYYLYCLERAMDILGKQLVGKRLWYPAGAKEILRRMKRERVAISMKKGKRSADGAFWMTNATHEPKDVLDTCFALLYLKRATTGLVPGGVVTGGEGAPRDGR